MSTITDSNGNVVEIIDFNSLTPKLTKKFSYTADGSDVGQDRTTPTANQKNPISIKSPLATSERFGAFDMYEDVISAVTAHIKNILLTNKGERLGNYNFGADVRRIIFESNIENVQDELARSIQDNISFYIPAVELLSMSIFTKDQIQELGTSEVLLRVTFKIKGININSSVNLLIGE